MGLRIVDCDATPSSITVVFSDSVQNGDVLANYTVESPIGSPLSLTGNASIKINPQQKVVAIVITGTPQNSNLPLVKGNSLTLVAGNGIQSATGTAFDPGGNTFATQVNGDRDVRRIARKATRAVEDAVSYPVLTEPVSFPSSPGMGAPSGIVGPSGGGSSLGHTAAIAVSNALGWKANVSDPKGFVGALTQSFTLTDLDGHVDATWNPRTYAVQTDLGGGITGAQASLYTRAKDALDQSLPLLDGLYPLDPEADQEDVKALRDMVRSQLSEIVKELGAVGGPSVLRVDTYFQILLGQSAPILPNPTINFDPDQVAGTLGSLRDTYGIYFTNNPFSNSIEDEQDITNFRVISDYTTSLLQSWISNKPFFNLTPGSPAFFGTQLVLISRQFSVIAETVNEVRFALNSVFIGPSEQQTLLLEFATLPPMFLAGMLGAIEGLVTDEGPRLIQEGGKFSVKNNILPVVKSLRDLADQARRPTNLKKLPDGYKTVRVQRTLDDLRAQLSELVDLASPIGRDVLPPELPGALAVFTITPTTALSRTAAGQFAVVIMGAGFRPGAAVSFSGPATVPGISGPTAFMSSNLLTVTLSIPPGAKGSYTVTVTNPDLTQVTGPASCVLTVT